MLVRRGAGDVLNSPGAQAAQMDCGLFNFGVFRPACWVAAAGGVPAIPNPPPAVPPAVAAGNATDADSAQADIDAAVLAAKNQQDAQNLLFFTDLANSNAAGVDCASWYSFMNPVCPGAVAPPWVWLVGAAVAGFVVINLFGGRR